MSSFEPSVRVCHSFTLEGFGRDSGIGQLYAELKREHSLTDADFDHGFLPSNGDRILYGTGDCKITATEVVRTAWRFGELDLLKTYAGIPDIFGLDPEWETFVTRRIEEIREQTKRKFPDERSLSFQSHFAKALFEFVRTPKPEGMGFPVPQFDPGRDHYSYHYPSVRVRDEDCSIECTANQALTQKEGWCTEASKILYAVYRIAGFSAGFADVFVDHTGRRVDHAAVILHLPDKQGGVQRRVVVDLAYGLFDVHHRGPIIEKTPFQFLATHFSNLAADLSQRGTSHAMVLQESRKAVMIAPDDSFILTNHAMYLYRQGRVTDAIHFLQVAANNNWSMPEGARIAHPHVGLGYIFENQSRILRALPQRTPGQEQQMAILEEAAQRHYEEAVKIDPKASDPHTSYGAFLYQRHREHGDPTSLPPEILFHLERGVTNRPTSARARTNLARALITEEINPTEGLRHLEAALSDDPLFPDAYKVRATYRRLFPRNMSKEEEPEFLDRLAELSGDLKANPSLSTDYFAAKKNERDARAYLVLGKRLYGSGDNAMARKALDIARLIFERLHVGEGEVYRYLGIVISRKALTRLKSGVPRERLDGDIRLAITHLKRAIELDRRDAESHLAMGHIHSELTDYGEATRHFESAKALLWNELRIRQASPAELVSLRNAYASAVVRLADIVLKSDKGSGGDSRLEEAHQSLLGVLKLDPLAAEAREKLSAVLFRQGKKGEAAREGRKAIAARALSEDKPKLTKRQAPLAYGLGEELVAVADYERALRCYESALVLDPANTSYFYALIPVLYIVKGPEAVLARLEERRGIKSEEIPFNLGVAYIKRREGELLAEQESTQAWKAAISKLQAARSHLEKAMALMARGHEARGNVFFEYGLVLSRLADLSGGPATHPARASKDAGGPKALYGQAIGAFLRAGNEPLVLFHLALSHAKRGDRKLDDYKRARNYFERLSGELADRPEALFYRGLVSLEAVPFDFYRRLVSTSPGTPENDPSVSTYLVAFSTMTRELGRAIRLFEQLEKKGGEGIRRHALYRHLGSACYRFAMISRWHAPFVSDDEERKKFKVRTDHFLSRSEEYLKKALELDSENDDLLNTLGAVYEATGNLRQKGIAALELQVAHGFLQEETPYYKLPDEIEPEEAAQAAFNVAERYDHRTYRDENQRVELKARAERLYRAALTLEPANRNYFRALFHLYVANGQEGEALKLYHGHELRDPQVAAEAGAIYFKGGRNDLAGTAYREAYALDPSCGDCVFWIASILSKRGDHRGAIRILEEGIASRDITNKRDLRDLRRTLGGG